MPTSNIDGKKIFNMIDNYIYLYHTDTFIIIPTYPETISDSMSASFSTQIPLSRSAPIYSYQSSGPRSMQINLNLHREMMSQINYSTSNAKVEMGDDYVDTMIKQIQSIALPRYSASDKMVDPPLIAVRIGSDIFIKGIVQGSVGVTYDLPIIEMNGKDKYGKVSVSFTVSEVDPYDAETVANVGGYRGLSTTLERNLWKSTRSSSGGASRLMVM